MKKSFKKYLLLEQLEERIFLDANPVAALDPVDPVDPVTDPAAELIPNQPILPPQPDAPAALQGSGSDGSVQEAESEQGLPAESATEDPTGDAAPDAEGEPVDIAAVDSATDSESVDNEEEPLQSGVEQQVSQDDTPAVEADGAGEATAENTTPNDTETESSAASEENQGSEPAAVEAIDPMIGEDFTFTAVLDNTSGTTLYGPYIDIYMPTSGDDGDDGVSFVDASYLGTPVSATVQTFDATGQILHPYAVDAAGDPLTISGTEGDTYVTLEMPFGSFTPDQPLAEVEITAHISENRQVDDGGGDGEDFDIQVYNGYRYGSDPLDNPATNPPVDPTLVSTQTFRPEVIRFEKVYIGPEQETATGPNYPRQYQITVDIADGQTIDNLTLTEHLPNEIYYMGDATVSVNDGLAFSVTSPNSAGGIFTDGTLTVALANPITGSAAANDVVVTFGFYVPDLYADGTTILDPASGDDAGGNEDREVINDVQVEGDWVPIDPRDRPSGGTPIHIVMDAEVDGDGIISPTPSIDEVFDAEAIAIQKTVWLAAGGDTGIIGGYNPGDIVQYTLTFQVSDYFNFGDIRIDDVLPDGLELQTAGSYAPTFSIQDETAVDGSGNPLPWTGTWAVGTNLTTTIQADDDTELHFDVSAAIIAAGAPDGILQGDLYGNAVLDSPATGTITYYALIKDEYASTGGSDSSGPGDISVDQGDFFTNSVTIEGQIYGDDGTGTLTSTGFDLDQDDSSAAFRIEVGQVYKQMYAINGNTDLSSFTDAQGNIHVQPDDTVTYRLQYHMPTSEFESFRFDDYLPLPVFNAAEITTFDNGDPAIPLAGHWDLHPDDTFSDAFPLEPITLETNILNGENRVSFIYDEHDDTTAQETWIDILFTVTVSDDPFADGLFLTNQVRGTEDGTPQVLSSDDAIIQIVLDEPVLEITKGIVQSNNDADIYSGNPAVDAYFYEPGSAGSRLVQPITSSWLDSNSVDTDIANIDAGDTITVAIIVENTGGSDAYDITITDVLPTGYTYVAASLQATNGNGDVLSYSGDLFGAGLILDDTLDNGALEGFDPTAGTNILVITYDLLLSDSVGPNQTLENTATLENYGGNNNAGNHVPGGISDAATALIPGIQLDKAIATTSQTHTSGSNAAIGETITYTVAITLPEGQATAVRFSDYLDADDGLQVISLDSLTTTSTDFTSSVGVINDLSNAGDPNNLVFLAANSGIAVDGLSFFVDFDTLSNDNRDNLTAETLTLTYTAVVRNINVNQNGVVLDNTAQLNWTDGNATTHSANDSETVTVVEPLLSISKTVDAPYPDEGDRVTFTILVQHPAAGSADAFDALLNDTLPGSYENVTITSQSGTGSLSGISDAVSVSGNTLTGSWDAFRQLDTYTIVVAADLVVDPQAGQTLSNTATIDWTSLPEDGDPHERTGTPAAGDPDDYITSATAAVTVVGTIDKVNPDPSSYAIGEEVQYYILVTLPEGNTDNLIVTDDLPAGMQYVAGSHALYTTVAGDPSGLLAGDFSSTIALDSVTGGASNGSPVSFSYGDIAITADNDPGGENDAFVIGLRALVLDVPGNYDDPDGSGALQATSLRNDTFMNYDNPAGGSTRVDDPVDPIVTVIEPWIETSKDVSPTAGVEAGDTLTYTITLTNGGNATAYEVNFSDTQAQGTAFGAIQTARIDGINTSLGTATANGDGSVITFSDDAWDLDPGQALVLTYTAAVTNAAVVDGSHVNTVDADWSSLDNNDPGEANERVYDEDDGVDSPVDGGLNADRDVDTAAFTIPGVTISKSDGGATEATIGDTITYTLTLSSPEGTIDNLVIEDVLAAGLIFNDDAVITSASGSFSTELSQAPSFTANDGSAAVTITWNLGDTVIDTDDPLVITYTARVADVVDNYDGEALGNTATLTYDNVDGDEVTDSDTDGLAVVEPWIETSKDVSPTAGVEAGDTLTYTITLTNDGNATAYEVNFSDTLAQGTTFGAIQTARIDGTDTSLGTATANGDGSVITFSDDAWDLDPGQALVLTYTAAVTNAAVVDGSHVNTVDADWSSLDNNDPGEASERVYDEDDGVDSPVDGGLNADRDVDTAAFAIPGVTISKSDGGATEATIGDTITYTLTLSSPEGTIDNLVIEDVLAAGLIFNDDAVITTASGSFSTELSQAPSFTANDGSAAVTITWNLGDTVIDTDDDLLITYTARVADVVDNYDGEALGNTVTLAYDNVDGDEVTDSDTDSLTVVEPQITTEKSVADSGDPGTDAEWNETITYTVRFTNSGNSTAYEVNAIDTLAPGTRFDGLSGTSSSFGAVADPIMTDNGDGTVSIFGNWDIPVGDYVEIEYTATVLDAVFLAPPHENTVDADWSSQDGVSLNERQYDDTGTSPVDGDLDAGNAAFSVITTGSIGDTVFFDTDQSGSETPGDTGITDILITLSGDTDGDGAADFTWTDVTDADGQYLFENLPAFDNYTVTVNPVNLPDGTEATYDLDGIDTVHVISGIVLGVAEARDDADFGYFNSGTGSIGDTVWYDADADGVLDAGEQGIGGVQLTLTGDITGDGLDDISLTTTTDENGNYTFAELLPGNYTVTVDPVPAGMEQTFDIDGLGSANAASLSLADGENNNNVDFGYTGAASIGDTIYFDADNSGTEDPGDAGIPGVTVTLTGDLNNDGIEDTLTTVTDENGTYLFANIPDGDYTIVVDPAGLPAGLIPTADPDGGETSTSIANIVGGVDNLDQDFGYTGTGIIGDTIWNDADGDGVQNGIETGLSGVDVTISVDFDGDGTADYTGTATTDGSGIYSFNNLPAGTYTIAVDTDSVPAGYVLTGDPDSNPDSTSTVSLAAGGSNLDQDFGYQDSGALTGSIGDTIYFDADGNSAQAIGEPGISGVTVTLNGDIDGDGTSENVTTTTDVNGNYLFDNLPAGTYTITVNPATLPSGMTPTQDPDGGAANSAAVALGEGEDNVDQDFGYNGTGSIGDTIFFDANNNGTQQSSEGGINGVVVNLGLDLDGDGIADYTDSATTDSNGNYLFEDLPAGEYTISVDVSTLPAGMIQSSDPDGSLDDTTTLNLAGGGNNLQQNFGYTGTGSIGDTVWNDSDGDGVQDSGEGGLAGIAVTISADIDTDGTPDYQETVTTDGNGNYLFDNLPEGQYTISVDPGTLPAGFDPAGIDPDGNRDNSSTISLAAGEDNLDQDFGYNSGTGSIGDTIYFDADNSGSETPGDAGIPGVTVTLAGDVNNDGIEDTLTAVTDDNGTYLFENLADGDYTITVGPATLPAGMEQTADPDGVSDDSSVITLLPDEDNLVQDFGYRGTGSIGDTIWEDADGDGSQDSGEGGLAGVDVSLSVDLDGDGTTDYTQTDTTDAAGNYRFDNLPAGQYTITVDTSTVPGTYVLTGDPDTNLDSTSTVNLPAGGSNLDQDFGYRDSGVPTGSLGDTIYFDADNNAIEDGDDTGLPGVSVTLTGDSNGDGTIDTVTTTTDSSGSYLFDNLPEGDYTITVDPTTLPAGMIPTQDPDGGAANSAAVVLGGGENNIDQDFGYTGSGSIGDTVYFDTDADGTQDSGENGMPNVDITISVDFDGDGNPDYTATTTTDGNGSYVFDNLPAGEYTVDVDTASLPGDVRPSGDPDGTLDNSAAVNLGAGATNNDQDFGYTGSGSIGDTIFYDADGNGYQSPGERGLPGVTVTLQGDVDNDGTIEAVTTTTDANGAYLFDNLTAGDYTIYVDTTTLPDGMTQTADPDATLDNQSLVALGAGETNLDQDFGYSGPSPFPPAQPQQPDEPVISVTAPPRQSSPEPVEAVEPGFIADAFFMYRQFGDRDDSQLFYPFTEQPWLQPPLPVSPVYSGHAEPGTTIELVLYDAMGNQVGYRSVMADTAGNWLADLPETIMYERPHHMEIGQTMSSYNESSAGFFNLRTYFYPSFNSMIYSSTRLDVETVFAYLPSTLLQSMHQSNHSTIDITWDGFDHYEFVAPSTHPARNSH